MNLSTSHIPVPKKKANIERIKSKTKDELNALSPIDINNLIQQMQLKLIKIEKYENSSNYNGQSPLSIVYILLIKFRT